MCLFLYNPQSEALLANKLVALTLVYARSPPLESQFPWEVAATLRWHRPATYRSLRASVYSLGFIV